MNYLESICNLFTFYSSLPKHNVVVQGTRCSVPLHAGVIDGLHALPTINFTRQPFLPAGKSSPVSTPCTLSPISAVFNYQIPLEEKQTVKNALFLQHTDDIKWLRSHKTSTRPLGSRIPDKINHIGPMNNAQTFLKTINNVLKDARNIGLFPS